MYVASTNVLGRYQPQLTVGLTVNLPSWKEYDWEGDIEHKSLLRYIDALIENARTQASIEIAVLLVPSHREVAGQSGAMSLAGWASTSDKVPLEPELKSFDERVYAVTLLELYTLSLQGVSPTSPRVDVAVKRLRKSRRCLKASDRDNEAADTNDVSSAPSEPPQNTESRSIQQKGTSSQFVILSSSCFRRCAPGEQHRSTHRKLIFRLFCSCAIVTVLRFSYETFLVRPAKKTIRDLRNINPSARRQ